jgi:prepilin-type N-terminal cleavage/methylation domain-containing protein
MMRKKIAKGFTLIELMVVIVIIGVLAAIAIPKFMDASTKAKFGEVPVVIASYDHAQLARIAETASLAATEDLLVMDKPDNSQWFSYGYTVPNAGICTYSASIKTGIALSKLTSADGSAQSVISTVGSPSHSCTNTNLNKYLPNFK